MEINAAHIIKTAFDPHIKIPLEAWHSFTLLGEIVNAEKDEVLKGSNNTEKYLYFILQGSGGIMLWNDNNFICIDLCYEGEFFGDYMSFLSGKPTPLEVMLFEPSIVFRISREKFSLLRDTTDFGKTICRLAAEDLFMHKQQQQIEILSKTAIERYKILQDRYPSVLQRTPQKHIASYLGITAQSLSRIRKKLAH